MDIEVIYHLYNGIGYYKSNEIGFEKYKKKECEGNPRVSQIFYLKITL